MKKALLGSALVGLALMSSFSMASVGVNHNGPQLNPYAASNAEYHFAMPLTKVEPQQPDEMLNAKSNPLYVYTGESDYNTGTGYSVYK